jgi:hypothetical protein
MLMPMNMRMMKRIARMKRRPSTLSRNLSRQPSMLLKKSTYLRSDLLLLLSRRILDLLPSRFLHFLQPW